MEFMESFEKILNALSEKYPEASVELHKFLRIHLTLKNLKFEPFIEPFSSFERENNLTSFTTELTPDLVNAWANHVSGSSLTRMGALESAILSEIIEGRLFTCYVLARSHMESASFVSYSAERLSDGIKNKKWDELRDMISKYFFGTSVKNEKENEAAQEYLDMLPEATKRFPPSPKTAIAAMQRYYKNIAKEGKRDFQMDYALLCDYVHHSMVGTRSFINVHEQNNEGWLQSYNHFEKISGNQIKVLLRIILPNMGIGYSNSLMLYHGESQKEKSGITFLFPPREVAMTFYEILTESLT
jgi:hypothetical protein